MKEQAVKKHLTIAELAERWGLATGTLSNWRGSGRGPKFLKLGREIRYPIEQVETWERQRLKKSTVG